MDTKYEFNAPKYVDFTQMNDTYDTSDNWFDEREGDEGGISAEMEPFYENVIGFTNATAAISAALELNKTVQVQIPCNNITKVHDSVETKQECNDVTSKVSGSATRRFQPARKTTSRTIDYAPSKRKLRDPVPDEVTKKKLRMTPKRVKDSELEKLKDLQAQTKARRQRNERNMKRALKGQSLKHPVLPKKFEESINNLKKKPTKPVPFNFILPDKMKLPIQNWESMAEATNNFHHKTPSRFRPKLPEEELRKKPYKAQQVTQPITPQLLTRSRTRNIPIESAKDIEEKIVEEMKRYQFKATVLNPKIMDLKGMYGVKPVPPSSNTEQKPFSFEVEQRINLRKNEDEAEASGSNKTTKRCSPLKPTIPQPFSFEERERRRCKEKENKIQQQLADEKKLHEFHARLLPSFSPEILPEVSTKEPTKPMPFDISEGSLPYLNKLEEKLRKEAEDDIVKRNFKAQECVVTTKEPFQPIKGLIPSTHVEDVVLNTETRAFERSKFESWLHMKEEKGKEEREKAEQEKQLEEEEDIKRLRKETVHKANPIRTFKPIKIIKSEIPLTEAKTPNLEVRRRAVFRELNK